MKRFVLALALSLAAAPAAAMEERHAHLFHYFSLEADYADWGEADRAFTFHGEGWIGTDEHRLWLKTEGEWEGGAWHEAEAQLLYGKPVSEFWDLQAGVRYDAEPRSTSYAVLGLHGLAPYFFETDAALFLGHRGDVSARAKASIDLFVTQRLVAEPYAETNIFFQRVEELGRGAGISDIDTGLKLRYEITRKFAPYIDFNYSSKLGRTRSMAKAQGEDPDGFAARLGLRVWLN